MAGTFVGSVIGLVPGIGGRMGIILTLPLAAAFEPYSAAIYLFALHSVVNTSGSIPAIAFGVPTSGAEAATVVDGYPLARMGRAGEALGASLSASAIGGVIGAGCFLLALPVARPLVTSFGPPELLLLAMFGITMISSLSSQGLLPGLIVAAVGAIFATVGVDFRTGEERFTFGSLMLWDGLELPAIVCGLFVIPEMLSMTRKSVEAEARAVATSISDVYRGMFVTLKYKLLVLRSSIYGVLVGATPAVGSTVAVWIAYSYAARTAKTDIPFGEGAIAGVIAPEAANNSKEGGAMIPSLLFAIPGSSSMAVMIAALGFCGVAVGPDMLGKDIALSYALAATVVLSNLLAVPFFFMVIPSLVRLSAVRMDVVAPLAIIASLTAALVNDPALMTLAQVSAAAVIGIALKAADWPRAPFILGFVIEQMAENAIFQTAALYGWSALTRPLTIVLLILMLVWIAMSMRRNALLRLSAPRGVVLACCAGLAGFFALTIALGAQLSNDAALFPIALSAVALLLCLGSIGAILLRDMHGAAAHPMKGVGLTTAMIASAPIISLPLASAAYLLVTLWRERFSGWVIFWVVACALLAQIGLLTVVFDLRIERTIIGQILWTLLG